MSARDTEPPTPPPPKKVRIACRRCRAKRVKCDGGTPACSNCSRASVPCVDVDGQNRDIFIPRNFITQCCARIRWLEQQIQILDPEFDLTKGPSVNGTQVDMSSQSSPGIPNNNPPSMSETQPQNHDKPITGKRTYDSVEGLELDRPLPAEASSVANVLGMLSLHSDSRQQHYMGSSSGLLFTKLIGAGRETQETSHISHTETTYGERSSASQISMTAYHSLYWTLAKELPAPEEAGILLGIYFQHIHIDQPFLHPASLANAYWALHESTKMERPGKHDSNGWMEGIRPFEYNGKIDVVEGKESTPISVFTAAFHVFMVFSLAATVLTRKKNFDHSPTRFYRLAIAEASDCFSSVSVTALQGILLLAVHSMACPAGLNIWTLSHIAMSHCIDLGLHREPDPSSASKTSLAINRLIFYTVYSLDRSISTIQGRPLGIRDETFDIRCPKLDDITDELLGIANRNMNISTPSTAHMSLSIRRFQLDQYISEIKLLFYHLPKELRPLVWPGDLKGLQARIKLDLDAWLTETSVILPPAKWEGDTLRFQHEKLKLETLYHSAITLLFQPSQVFRSPSQSALQQCYQSNRRKIRIYNHLNTEDQVYYSWRNIHGIFSAGATMVYCIWACPALQAAIPFAEVLWDLRTCSNLLSIGGQWWPSVRNGKGSFDQIVDLTIRRLSRSQPPSPRTRRRLEPPSTDISGQPDITRTNLDTDIFDRGMQVVGETSSYPMGLGDLLSMEDPGLLPPDTTYLDASDTAAIDSAMESFLAEFVHGDWSWDPFAGSTVL
ncbi:hypothetical protein BO94DRAFT_474531 [Aspergillus sclerotioniger CBS 115572]|uniref:Zn(2)-C6 fungal-type domain-containing protein n=1 Tax=Aspergillus sclerotioniger CBS 115572 TaxID=1450535 RepID=A0A317VNT2_9EURO|nr:hypothetical protein BO94DRAFT_474531 [Aspergillus sclerotioniger CBS 115572]PWY74512.1 hypothetical protein BO94DRAFT_474531 [Aspergillus sclerotioniger CBS 115572]